MMRLAVEKICGYLLIGAISISVSSANGQYQERQYPGAPSADQSRLPLNQLPPIVSSDQAKSASSMLQPVKGLYIPPDVGNLPPIVSPGQQKQQSVPFVYPQNSPAPVSNAKTSNGGVPIYSGGQPFPITNTRPIVRPLFQGSDTRNTPVFQTPGSGTRSLPPIVNAESKARSLPTQGFVDSLAPGDLPAVPDVELEEPGSVVESGVPAPRMATPTIVDSSVAPGVPGTNNFFEQPTAPVGTDGGCGQACQSCGPSGCYDLSNVQAQNGCCGSVSNAGYYLFADALFWSRADGDVQLSNFFGLNDFEYVGGWRFTLGSRNDSTSGTEFTYFGTGDLDESRTVNNAGGNLNALFTVNGGLGASGFFNAVTQRQTKETQLQSMEYNRIKWGWDVLKSFVGVRYIYFDDSYSLFSTNGGGTNGLFVMDSVNNLFGVHGGWELFYDVGYRASASLTSKFGAYINSAKVDTNLFNGGVQFLGQEQEDSSIASTFELGLMTHYQLSPRSRFRLGYDLFLMWGAYTIENNAPRNTFARGFQTGAPTISPTTGTDLNTNNEPVLFHGVSFGFEVFR